MIKALLDELRHTDLSRLSWLVRREFNPDFRRLRRFCRTIEPALAKARPSAGDERRVLFATMTASLSHFQFEALLGQALALRGAEVEYVICDLPNLPICTQRVVTHQRRTCPGCIERSAPLARRMRLRWHRLSDFLDRDAIGRAAEIVGRLPDRALDDFVFEGYPLGRWIRVSLCHFLLSDGRDEAPETRQAKRDLLLNGIVYIEAARRFVELLHPTTVIALSGKHLEWRVPIEIGRQFGADVYCYETLGDPTSRNHFDYRILTHNSTPDQPNLEPAWTEWKQVHLSEAELRNLDALLLSRRDPSGNVWVNPGSNQSASEVARDLGVKLGEPIAVAFPSVFWDLMAAEKDVAFEGQFDWLGACVDYFSRRPQWRLVIRAHPGEARAPWGLETRKKTVEALRRRYPSLPSNVSFIEPQATFSSYALVDLARVVLVYTSTFGMEAAAQGKPVILSGDPHYRGKGFTFDVTARAELGEMLERYMADPMELPESQRILAKKFLYLIKTRLSMPFGWTDERGRGFLLNSAAELIPGANPVLDAVCDAIFSHQDVPIDTAIRSWSAAGPNTVR